MLISFFYLINCQIPEMLKTFENDYSKVKENVPDYDEILDIINTLNLY